MLHTIQNYVTTLLPSKRKISSKGWFSFNGICCHHRGERADSRSRGGVIANPSGAVTYSCFNCGYKASYTPGYPLNFKFRKFLEWMGADENEIKRLIIEAIRIKNIISPEELAEQEAPAPIEFKKRTLPDDAQSFDELVTFYTLNNWEHAEQFENAIGYCAKRKVDVKKYKFYMSPSRAHNLNQRVIVPCYWKKELIGYTARAISDNISPKYHNHYELNFVFNMDVQDPKWKFVLVSEGPFDAMAIDGVAVLHNEVTELQADIIDSLGREVIVVPDTGPAGAKLVADALKYGWSVSYPIWQETCKDISAAVEKYGKLFVLNSILSAKETNKLKIEILQKRKYTNKAN